MHTNIYKNTQKKACVHTQEYLNIPPNICLYKNNHIYIYTHIYCHPQTHCFIVSQLISVARTRRMLKLGSKPTQLYVRLSIRPLDQQAYHVGLEIIRYYVATAAAVFVCLHFLSYQSSQFVRIALHYVRGSCKFLRQSAQPPWRSVHIITVLVVTKSLNSMN